MFAKNISIRNTIEPEVGDLKGCRCQGSFCEKVFELPQGEHNTLQGELCDRINDVVKAQQIVYAFPELRCTFDGASIVPDVVVYR
jgi:Uma2 family endonuclease